MATKKKASKSEISAYLKMMKDAAKGLNADELDLTNSMDLVNIETGETVFKFQTFPASVQRTLAPQVVDENYENEFETTETESNENEFEATDDRPRIVDFWKYETEKIKIGIFLGEGRTIGTGNKKTETFLFFDEKDESYFIVPQWKCLEYFKTAATHPQYKYRLKYCGVVTMKTGDTFHKIEVEKGKAPISKTHDNDLSKLVCPLN